MSAQLYPHVFQPLRIGPVWVRNRLFMTAHGLGYAVPDPNLPGYYLPSERHAFYYAERARGGAGLIIQESTIAHPTSQGSTFGSQVAAVAAAFPEKNIPYFRTIADLVHEHGAKLFLQLWHGGHHADPRWDPGGPRLPTVSASDIPAVETCCVPREMTHEEIRSVCSGFAQSTRNVRQAGYDGVEIQGSHSALIEQFLSPFYNKRTDEYGGNLENRLRFLTELIDAVRDAAGSDMAVGARLNTDELLLGGLSQDDFKEIAQRLDELGKLDFIDFDIGTMHTAPLMIAPFFVPKLPAEDFIANVRLAVRQAAVLGCPGRLTDPADAERLIAEGKMDMVGATRAWIADPELAIKAEEGRVDAIRVCIACNHCLEGIATGVNCVINPATGRERSWGTTSFRLVAHPKRILIVGGGPAGLEAARVAALCGHKVTVYERKPVLGGAYHMIAALPSREVVEVVPHWYERQLGALGVGIYTGTEVTVETVKRERPDVVVVATGATFDRTGATGFISWPIPGWQQDFVYVPEQILEEKLQLQGNVVVLDEEGDTTGAGIAELLAGQGARVELVSRWQQIAPRLHANLQFAFVLPRLYGAGVTQSPNTYIREIGNHTVTLFNIFTNEQRVVRGVAGVVLVGRRKSVNLLAKQVESLGVELYVIGDALSPRSLLEASYEGHWVGRQLAQST